MRCSHHLVSRLLAANLDIRIPARVQGSSCKQNHSQLDDRFRLSSPLHEPSRVFNRQRPLSLRLSAPRLSEGHRCRCICTDAVQRKRNYLTCHVTFGKATHSLNCLCSHWSIRRQQISPSRVLGETKTLFIMVAD